MDSSYADAYVYKAYALHLLGNLKYRDPIVSYKEAEYYALRALSFDRSNGQAYGVLGNIYANQYRWELAETSFKIALESRPGDAMLNYWYSLVKRTRGQIEEAIEYNERAKLLDPLYPVVHAGFIATCIYGKKYDLAWKHIEKDSMLFADNFVYHWVKAEYFSAKQEYEKAVDHFQRGIKLNPQIKSLQTGKAYAMAKLGDNTEAINIIQKQSTEIAAQIHTTAVLLAAMGNYEESLKNFIKAAEKGFIASDVLVDPTYASFVENTQYQSYLRKYNFID
jgi:tetratricopeptide (TPR) repeat protein